MKTEKQAHAPEQVALCVRWINDPLDTQKKRHCRIKSVPGESYCKKHLRTEAIRALACEQHDRQSQTGALEIDSDAKISEGEYNGAYVQAWVWVNFSGTELDKGDS